MANPLSITFSHCPSEASSKTECKFLDVTASLDPGIVDRQLAHTKLGRQNTNGLSGFIRQDLNP